MIGRLTALLLGFMGAVLLILALLSHWDYDVRVVVGVIACVFIIFAAIVEFAEDMWG